MTPTRLVVFGVASDGSVAQWDGHKAHRGIMLRWFVPDGSFPEFGFDIYRAQLPDIPPIPFDDATVAAVAGTPSWTYAGVITLACASGLTFEPSALQGNNRLVVTPNAPVTISFTGLAWQFQLRAETIGAGLDVAALVDGAPVKRQRLTLPGEGLLWRTRGLSEVTIEGEGSLSFIGFHLLDDPRYWSHLAHRCLPVHDAAYACGPRAFPTEEEEASSRLPAPVAATWPARFATPFQNMLPPLHRLARGEAPAPVPPDTLDPRQPRMGTANEATLIRLASLDPHGARILGLAYDDPIALDGREYAYKVRGIWRRRSHVLDLRNRPVEEIAELLTRAGAEVENAPRRQPGLVIRFPQGAWELVLDIAASREALSWRAEDDAGTETSGSLGGRNPSSLTLPRVVQLELRWDPVRPPMFRRVRWNDVEQSVGLLPAIAARESGPPPGPASVLARLRLPDSPSGTASADLDWPLPLAADQTVAEGDVVAYQIGHRHLAPDPAAPAPAPGGPTDADLVRPPAPLYLSQESASQPASDRVLNRDRVLYRDDNDGAGLDPGWWAWWVRGVDLFGRASVPSGWTVAAVKDTRPAPAPVMVQAEWVQRGLPEMTVAVLGRSVEARRWLDSSAAGNGLVASWTLPPEQSEDRDDIDGFQLLLRRARAVTGAPAGSPLEYPPWPAPIAAFGPVAIKATGTITSAAAVDPALMVTLSARETMPASLHAASPPAIVRTAFRTDLELDGASSVFVGGTLTVGADSWPIVANGDGPSLTIVVEHAANAPAPTTGQATVTAPAGRLVELTTDAPTLAGASRLTARSGLLAVQQVQAQRYFVLRRNAATFLCLRPAAVQGAPTPVPAVGDGATWHPVWCTALDDAGFGPAATAQIPVANAQVAVQAVRLTQTRALASAPSATVTVTAVDVVAPNAPSLDTIQFDPAGTCAQLATRADWYGRSYFTLAWTTQPDCAFTVYRALADEIFRLDRAHLSDGGTRDIAEAMWPPNVWNDATRKDRVEEDLAALEAARPDAADWERAYDRLRIDAQMLLARQEHAWPAFMPLFGRPIADGRYTDTLNGRSHGHWIYAVTSRSRAGVESAPSEISPPICYPDVVAPAPPLAHSALAAEGAVKLKWLASPDADTHHYEIFAARGPEAEKDLDLLAPVPSHDIGEASTDATATYAPNPHVSGKTIERLVPRARNEMGDWCFWIAAVDTSGNRSRASRMLRGKALVPPPLPPVWGSAVRNGQTVNLTWTYPTGQDGYPSDPRWACQVERRRAGTTLWQVVSPLLPRAIYAFSDTPPDLEAGWDYRLIVTDHLGQIATVRPIESLPPEGGN